METIKQYLEKNKQRFIDELFELIRIPSVSSRSEHKEDMIRAANFLKEKLSAAGADKSEIFTTQGNPVVYGEKMVGAGLPTILVYGHYDVMPVDPLDQWVSPPFEPQIRDGKIYARGADDDKGQLYMHVKALEYMIASGTLPCNVKFMFEGEEEIGSSNLITFCEQHKELLTSDVILVSDTSLFSKDVPSITIGLRGICCAEVEVTGPNRDLHSGIYGGAVDNPLNILCKMISSLKDEENRIAIPGFYDDVSTVSVTERKEIERAPFDTEKYKKELNIKELAGEKGYSTIERTGIRPTLDLNGIWGGYTGEGSKTIIPSKAHAKISMRLVPNQDPNKIGRLFETHFKSIAPDSVKVSVKIQHGGYAYVCPSDSPAYQAALRSMEEVFGKSPIPVRSGGSIPVITHFEKILGVKSILLGFGLESDAIHSPNENFPLNNFFMGIETIPLFFSNFTKSMQ